MLIKEMKDGTRGNVSLMVESATISQTKNGDDYQKITAEFERTFNVVGDSQISEQKKGGGSYQQFDRYGQQIYFQSGTGSGGAAGGQQCQGNISDQPRGADCGTGGKPAASSR